MPKGVVWRLQRAIYGLSQSPKRWADERDTKLRELRVKIAGSWYHLSQNQADSQVWGVYAVDEPTVLLGLVCVRVDDFRSSRRRAPFELALWRI